MIARRSIFLFTTLLSISCLYLLQGSTVDGERMNVDDEDSIPLAITSDASTFASAPPPDPFGDTRPSFVPTLSDPWPGGFPLAPYTPVVLTDPLPPLTLPNNVSAIAAALLHTAFIEVVYGHPTTAVQALQASTRYGCSAGVSDSNIAPGNATIARPGPLRDVITSLATDDYTFTWPPHLLHADTIYISDDPRALPRPPRRRAAGAADAPPEAAVTQTAHRPAADAPWATATQGDAATQSFHEASLVKARGGALHAAIRAHHAACAPVVRAHARNGAYAMPPMVTKRVVPPARVPPAVASYTRVYVLPFDHGPAPARDSTAQHAAAGASPATGGGKTDEAQAMGRARVHVAPGAVPGLPSLAPHETAEVAAVVAACHAVRQVEYGMMGYSTDGTRLPRRDWPKYLAANVAPPRPLLTFDRKPVVPLNETMYEGINVARTIAAARLLSRSPADVWPPLGNVTNAQESPTVAAVTPRMTGAVACEWVMAALTGASSWRQRPDGFGLSCATHIVRPPVAPPQQAAPGDAAAATTAFTTAVYDRWQRSSRKPERFGGAPIAAVGTGAHSGLGWMCDPLLMGGGWAVGRGLVSLDHGAVVTFRDEAGGPAAAEARGAAEKAASDRGAPDRRAPREGGAAYPRGVFALLIEAVDAGGAATCTDGDTWSADVISRSGTVRYSTHVHSLGRGLYLAPIRVADDGEYVVSVALHYDRYAWLHPPAPQPERSTIDTCCLSSCHARLRPPLVHAGSPLYAAPFTMHLPFSHLSFRHDTRYMSYAISAIVTVKGTDTYRAAEDPPVCGASHLTHRFPVGSRWVRIAPPYDCPKGVCVGRVVPASACAHWGQSVEGCNATWAFVPGNCVLRMYEPEAAWDVVSDRYIGVYGDSITSDIALSMLLALYGSTLDPRYRIPRTTDLFLNRPTASSFVTHPRAIRDSALVQRSVPLATSKCKGEDACWELAARAAPIRCTVRESMGAAWRACELTLGLRVATLKPTDSVGLEVLDAVDAVAHAHMYVGASGTGGDAMVGSARSANATTAAERGSGYTVVPTATAVDPAVAARSDPVVVSAEAEWRMFEPGRGVRVSVGFSGHHVPDGHLVGADSIRHAGGLRNLQQTTTSHAALLPPHADARARAARPLRLDRPDVLLTGSAAHDAASHGYRSVMAWWPRLSALTGAMADAMASAGDPIISLYELERLAVAAAERDDVSCAVEPLGGHDADALLAAVVGDATTATSPSAHPWGLASARPQRGPRSALERASEFANVSSSTLTALFRTPMQNAQRRLHYAQRFTRLAESHALFAMAVANATGHLGHGSAGLHAVASGAWTAAASLGLPLSNVLRGALEESRQARAGTGGGGATGDRGGRVPQQASTIIYHVPPQIGVGAGPDGTPGYPTLQTGGRLCRALNPHRVQRIGLQLEDVLRAVVAPETRAGGVSCGHVGPTAGAGVTPPGGEAASASEEQEPAWAPYVDARVWLPWGTQAGPSLRLLAAMGGSVCREGGTGGGGVDNVTGWPSLWEWDEWDDAEPASGRTTARQSANQSAARARPRLLVYDMDTITAAWSGLYGSTDDPGVHIYPSPIYAAMQGQLLLNLLRAALHDV